MQGTYTYKLGRVQPLGAVQCGDCGENKHSGNEITLTNLKAHEIKKLIRCDDCTDELRNNGHTEHGRTLLNDILGE